MSFVGKTLASVAIVGIGVWAAATAANAQTDGTEHGPSGVIEQSTQPVEVTGPEADGVALPAAPPAVPGPAVTVHPDGSHSVDGAAPTASPADANLAAFDQAAADEFAAAVPIEPTFGTDDGRTVRVEELPSLTEEQQQALLESVQSGHGANTTSPAP